MDQENSKPVDCSFCGKNYSEVPVLVQALQVAICYDCIETSRDIALNGLRKLNEAAQLEPEESPIARIAGYLKGNQQSITDLQEWASVYWVKGKGVGSRFVSKSAIA